MCIRDSKKTLNKIDQIILNYNDLRFEKAADVPAKFCETTEHFRRAPLNSNDVEWADAPVGTKWGGNWISAWFVGEIKLPASCSGKKVFVQGNTNGESLVIANDRYIGAVSYTHLYSLNAACMQ